MPEQFPDVPPKDPVIVHNDFTLSVSDENIEWDEGLQEERFNFPTGTKTKIIHEDPAVGRVEKIVRMPPDYVEPEHSHEGAHAVMVLDGEMHVHGEVLTGGDYLFGQKVPHGPMEYPEGCMVFASFVGGSAALEWEDTSE